MSSGSTSSLSRTGGCGGRITALGWHPDGALPFRHRTLCTPGHSPTGSHRVPSTSAPSPRARWRIAFQGSNRYATAVAVSEATFDPGVPIVYVATGKAFPDALAAAAAAGALGGPVLLSDTTSISSDTLAEIRRLSPNRIVVVGGTSAVSDAVKEQLAEIAPTDRIGGSNRYDTAARIALDAFDGPVPIAYVATGKDFPDALAAAAAAGAQGGPVLLTEPGFLPSWTSDALIALQPNKIVVVGGTAVVSTAVEASQSDPGQHRTRRWQQPLPHRGAPR